MCGIFFSNRRTNLDTVADFIAHRGTFSPDVYIKDGRIFAHALMPVQGRAPIHQPIVDTVNGAEHVLLFAGELWKHASMASDTQYLFEQLAVTETPFTTTACLRGMFAFVYQRGATTFFATDIFGEQPLYYAERASGIAVATEIKQLAALGYSLKEIQSVLPGRLYVYTEQEGAALSFTYSQIDFAQQRTPFTDAEKLRGYVAESVRERVNSNDLQRSAVLLSGGLDSSIIAYEASRLGIKDAYTVALDAASSDFVSAREVASSSISTSQRLYRTRSTLTRASSSLRQRIAQSSKSSRAT
jgi:asparagine synthetase B (glutamine-hydrolysing)